VEPRNFGHSFERRIITADVPRITRHSTRKTHGSLLAALDVHPRVAIQILRRSRSAITMEVYTEVPSAATREALRKLGQWLVLQQRSETLVWLAWCGLRVPACRWRCGFCLSCEPAAAPEMFRPGAVS
jgi:hypothetical protein